MDDKRGGNAGDVVLEKGRVIGLLKRTENGKSQKFTAGRTFGSVKISGPSKINGIPRFTGGNYTAILANAL